MSRSDRFGSRRIAVGDLPAQAVGQDRVAEKAGCQTFEFDTGRAGQFQRRAGAWVGQPQADRGEQQSAAVELLSKQAVVVAVAIGGVANYGMKDVFEVTPDLMLATGLRGQFD